MNPLVLAQLINMIGPLLGMVAQRAAARPSPEPQDQAPRIDAATISALTALVAAAAQRQESQQAPKMPAMSAFVSIVILLSAIATNGEIALPSGIAGVGRGQAFADGEAVAEGFQRVGQIALRHQHVADLAIGDGEIALA